MITKKETLGYGFYEVVQCRVDDRARRQLESGRAGKLNFSTSKTTI